MGISLRKCKVDETMSVKLSKNEEGSISKERELLRSREKGDVPTTDKSNVEEEGGTRRGRSRTKAEVKEKSVITNKPKQLEEPETVSHQQNDTKTDARSPSLKKNKN